MKLHFDKKEKRALAITAFASVLFGAFFLRHYFSIIIVGAIMAYIFHPMREALARKLKRSGLATAITLVVAFLVVIIPLVFILALTVFQVQNLVRSIPRIEVSDITAIGSSLTATINNILSIVPGEHTLDLSRIASSMQGSIRTIAQGFLDIVLASVGGIPRFFTNIILFLFIFASFLNNGTKVIATIKKLNPLGSGITDLYLQKMGDMTKAVVKGQFVIAFCQGLIGAGALYLIGWHNIFFFMLLALTVLSVIPLGSGIVVIPMGIAMILFGDYWQGAFILFTHFVIVTNIDNFLRARLVPKSARMNSALMMLAVFSGIAMFGFLGIVAGPVIMILILSTIEVYMQLEEHPNANVEIKETTTA